MIGEPRQNLEDVYADLLITKLTNVMDDESHPLHDRLAGQLISRSGCMRLPSAVTGRYLSSFVPQAIRIHNANFQRGAISIDMYIVFYSYLVCIFVSFHYVRNFQKWSNKVLLDLT